ncbi:hypothetical protein [Spiroplasma platyhelix]|uniref:Uncharacterized protein n=1 Tax=Spiroplasma platyhelix PALS-1 TaxID=1276218 RepID=A0A846U5L6_9MOLU|nr:hypothetical protein [Spiroplasma platyhelix]MBE4704375.1 hypothetical protein [Spiroplasma platyhelix PALS-1]NKE38747.1 hypothetical protein [Spiroplasma platyhelix PALS-1]UJB28958.1 hypothetical protein SPLAT_v1c01930 [Spiroplasma platyhelix PALS-1]
MPKLLISLAGLALLTTASTSLTQETINTQIKQNFSMPQEWNMKPATVSETKGPNESLKFIVSVIDLTSLKIKDEHQFLHDYKSVIIPELKVSYNGFVALDTDSWNVKDMRRQNNEIWTELFKQVSDATTMTLERGYYLYYDVFDRHLMLRLSYRASMIIEEPTGNKGGEISFSRGSVINIT